MRTISNKSQVLHSPSPPKARPPLETFSSTSAHTRATSPPRVLPHFTSALLQTTANASSEICSLPSMTSRTPTSSASGTTSSRTRPRLPGTELKICSPHQPSRPTSVSRLLRPSLHRIEDWRKTTMRCAQRWNGISTGCIQSQSQN
jgi:hypothetical protein